MYIVSYQRQRGDHFFACRKFKGGVSCCAVDCTIVVKLQDINVVSLVLLVCIDVVAHILLNPLVDAFRLAIRLGVVC